MSTRSLVFLGSSSFALPSLRQLVEGDIFVSAVITRPDRPSGRGKKLTATPVKEGALAQNLTVCQPENKKQLLETLQELQPQLLINVAYGMILPDAVLALPPLGCLNLHPSLLPSFRGAAPIQRTLMAGESVTGVTVLFMTKQLDAGDIVLQEQVPIGAEEDFGTLHDRLAEQGAALLLKAVQLQFKGEAPRVPQDHGQATFAPPLTREEEEINWSAPAEGIFNQVRALAPSPGAYTNFRGMRLKVWQARLPDSPSAAAGPDAFTADNPPGTICHVDNASLAVQCGRGVLLLHEVQPESKRRMDARSFAQGYRLEAGEKIG